MMPSLLHTSRSGNFPERDENTCRKDFLPTEKVSLTDDLAKWQRAEAKKRQKQGGRDAGRGRPKRKSSGKLPEPKGDSRDKIGAAVGVSGRQYEKAAAVVKAGKTNPELFGDLPDMMDRTGKHESQLPPAGGVSNPPPVASNSVPANLP